MPRKIAVITGTRADYGIYRPILREISIRPELSLAIIATGMHLVPEFGNTFQDIEADGYLIDARVEMLLRSDSRAAMIKSLGICLIGLTQALEEIKPEIVLLLGDRGEMLAGAIAAAHLGMGVAHIHGGELSGSVDDCIRHAITKFAHLHFPATKEAAGILLASGENSRRIFVSGTPGMDDLAEGFKITRSELELSLGFGLEKSFLLVIYHPVVGEELQSQAEFTMVLKTLAGLNIQSVLFLPNSDAGRELLIRALEEAPENPRLYQVSHLPRRLYLGTMAQAKLMIGNSSSGLIEAPGFGLPVINIGNRQRGRLRAGNVVDIGFENLNQLDIIIRKYLAEEKERIPQSGNPYKCGASKLIAEKLATVAIDKDFLTKDFSFSSQPFNECENK